MTALDNWLRQATRSLAKESAAQVRAEIHEHYESAREAFMAGGATPEEADQLAVAALGDAQVANRQYRKVLLTYAEARLLRQSSWIRAVNSWVNWVFLATCPATVLPDSELRLVAVGMTLFFAASFLPVYSPGLGRAFRYTKVAVLLGTLGFLTFRPHAIKSVWLLIGNLCYLGWTEWRRISIRGKLPVARWPKQLYL